MSATACRETVADESPNAVIPKVRTLLNLFDARAPVLGLSELSRRSGLPKTTVHRLIQELAACEFLERDGRRYRLGSWLFELGQHVTTHRSLRYLAAPYLEDVSHATAETVVVCIPGHNEMLFAEKYVGSRGRGQVVTQVEGRVPMHCGASGKAVLAYGPPELLDRVLASGLEARTAYTITDPARLRSELAQVREQGFAVERQELIAGYGAVAAPVRQRDLAVGALTVIAPISRLDVNRYSVAVQLAARGLSRALTDRAPSG